MEAQILLKQGAVRRVGKSTTTSILNDLWLPSSDPYIVTDHKALHNKNVDALMNLEHNAWDTDLIKDIFVDRDVQLILSIPLKPIDEDTWYWNKDSLGHYTVKSGYAAL